MEWQWGLRAWTAEGGGPHKNICKNVWWPPPSAAIQGVVRLFRTVPKAQGTCVLGTVRKIGSARPCHGRSGRNMIYEFR